MNDPATTHYPAPQRDRLSGRMAALLLCAGPFAWFVQLCAGVALIGAPCFPAMDRLTSAEAAHGWTYPAAAVLIVAAAIAAIAATLSALHLLRQVHDEGEGSHEDLLEIGHGRTRFIVLWAAYLGAGSAVATLATLAGFALVPRCLG